MNNKIDIVRKLIGNINKSLININVLNKNIEFLIEKYNTIKKIWSELNIINIKIINLERDSELYNNIINILNNCYLNKFKYFKKTIKNIISIKLITYLNVSFYYIQLDNSSYEEDIIKFKQLFFEAITLAKYYNNLNISKNIMIIWLPINKSRDFNFDIINKDNLVKSMDNFNAFTASGVTFGTLTKISILTRYEEINKLMYHELIHNFGVDGTSYHDFIEETGILLRYKKIKENKSYHYDYSIYESYTELLSSYLNIIFRILEENKLEHKLKNIFLARIIIEIVYSYNTISNIIKLNNFTNYNDFIKNKTFVGEICFYEYYFLKALLYNNLVLKKIESQNDYLKLYEKIIEINHDDLLKEIFDKSIKQNNFSYIFYLGK
jgi:hypothetical protein